MSNPAQTLTESQYNLSLEPLGDEASEYADLSAARGSNCLRKLEVRLREHLDSASPRCHLAFVGHRGSGKSTELLRLEHKLGEICFPIHLTLDATLHQDADYPDLFLWLVESIAQKLQESNVPFDEKHINSIADWYASVTKSDTESITKKIGVETNSEASVGGSWFGTGFKVLAAIKSAFVGSKETRTEMRRDIKNRADELIQSINNFLSAASDALKANGKPHRLLIVQDNLDRLSREAAVSLFDESAELLQQLNAACLWTASVGTLLAPFNLGNKFEVFPMPMISVRKKNGGWNQTAIRGLEELVAKRMEISLTFDDPKRVREVIRGCGGSVRELIRLINSARLNALVDSHPVIKSSDIKMALKNAAIGLQNALTPTNIYFPILAQIANKKDFEADLKDGYTPEAVDARREFFHTLITAGAVFAYNGDGSWYDVHPTLHLLDSFSTALTAIANAAKPVSNSPPA